MEHSRKRRFIKSTQFYFILPKKPNGIQIIHSNIIMKLFLNHEVNIYEVHYLGNDE